MSDKKPPYYDPKIKQDSIVKEVAKIIKQLADAAPKIDHTCKVVKNNEP